MKRLVRLFEGRQSRTGPVGRVQPRRVVQQDPDYYKQLGLANVSLSSMKSWVIDAEGATNMIPCAKTIGYSVPDYTSILRDHRVTVAQTKSETRLRLPVLNSSSRGLSTTEPHHRLCSRNRERPEAYIDTATPLCRSLSRTFISMPSPSALAPSGFRQT